MTLERTCKLLNDVERNLSVGPDVADRLANHLRTFWTPAMRRAAYELTLQHPLAFTEVQRIALCALHATAKA